MKLKKRYYICALSTIILLILTILSCNLNPPQVFQLKITNDGNGQTYPTNTVEVKEGKPLEITAIPGTGFTFNVWEVVKGSGVEFDDENSASTTVTLTEGDATIIARFSPVQYILTITTLGNGTTNPAGSITVNHDEAVDISATPETGWKFNIWETISGTGVSFGNATEAETTVILTSGNATIRARFIEEDSNPVQYTLTITTLGNGITDPGGSVTVNKNEAIGISATPDTGWEFNIWETISGTGVSFGMATNADTTVTLTAGNATIRARFIDEEAPSGYSVVIDQSYIDEDNDTALSFTYSGVAPGDWGTYHYSINDTNGGTLPVTGSGTVTAASAKISGINVSSLDDGTLTIGFYVKDPEENVGETVYDTVKKDTVAPSFHSIDDAGDGNYRAGQSITLYVDMDETGLTMRADLSVLDSAFSSNQALADDGDGTYSYTTAALNSGTMSEGTAIAVEFSATDSVGHVTTDDSFTLELDKTPPDGSFAISVDYTQSVSVSLTMSITGASQMRFGNTVSERNAAAWETYSGTRSWTLGSTSQVGTRTVYGEFRDAAGNTYTASDETLFVKKLTASVGAGGDYFGCSVAASSDGSIVIGGAYGDNSSQGAAYAYYGTIWSSEKIFTDTVYGGAGDLFGDSVGISGSGSVAAIGAYADNSNSGHVWIRHGVTWGSAVRLALGAANDYFGDAVAVSEDGTVVVAGAIGDDTIGSSAGAAYINYGTLWGSNKKLTASDGAASDYFGYSVAVSADGSVVVVGAYYDDDGGTNSGSVYVYSGSNWATETKLTASDAAASDFFGSSVAVSADGSTVVVGAYGDDDDGTDSGSVYVYTGVNWATEKKLTASDGITMDYFGSCVSVSSDGSVIAIGAYGDDDNGSNSGSVYVYNGTNWGTEIKLTAFDGAASDSFGTSVSISSDGSTIAIGASGDDMNEGAVYLLAPVTVPW